MRRLRALFLKQGYSFIEMGDKKAARGILEQLKEKYPKSKEAALAKKKLEEMNKKARINPLKIGGFGKWQN